MRAVWILAATAACRFDHGALPPRDAGTIDADERAPDADVDAAVDARSLPACDPDDDSLIACYPFEGSTQDVSGNNLHASMTNVSFVPGRSGMALQSAANSVTDVADSPLFDVAAFTLQAWIFPTQLPSAGERAGIIDVEGQYGVFLYDAGRLRCTTSNATIVANIPEAAWSHIACTFAAGTTTIYVDGVQRYQAGGGGTLPTNGSTGMSIAANNPPGSGQRLIGLIDDVRIYSVARTTNEICSDALCN